MKSIEKTKKNISLSEIDELERKKLFNDFIEAGGEVITEKDRRGLQDFDREIQKRYKNHLENYRRESGARRVKSKTKSKGKNKSGQKQTKINNAAPAYVTYNISRIRLFFQRLRIRYKLYFMKVTDSTGTFFNPKFLSVFDNEFKTSLQSLQITYTNSFMRDSRLGKKITDQLDRMHPVYFELIELLSNVFDRSIMNEILEHYYNFPDVPQPIVELRDQLTKIFKKLYPLSPYKGHILTGLEKANNIYTRSEKNTSSSNSWNRRKYKNDVYLVFDKLYPRLYWLMCYYEGRIFLTERDLENCIPVSIKDVPGKRKKNEIQYFDLPYHENIHPEEDEKVNNTNEKDVISDSIKNGLSVMNDIDLGKLSRICLKDNIFTCENFNDKVYITNLLFDEFDREYSFILTTNKIKYNIFSKSGEKIDFKNKFINIYNDVSKCKNRLKEYAETLTAFEKQKKEKPISNTQFIEYSNRLTALENERTHSGMNSRMYIKAFLENLCKELKILITDINGSKEIIANPDDIIIFETEIEGEKKLNNKKIQDVISETYNFITAFIYRLDAPGDLCGDLEIKEEDRNFIERNLEVKAGNHKPDNEEKSKKNDSVLKELDDLV